MSAASFLLAAWGPCSLLCMGFIPSKWANSHVQKMRTTSMALSAMAFVLALAGTVALAWHGPIDVSFALWSVPIPLSVGVFVDNLTIIMLLLISFVGMVIVRFSMHYLDGEATQGRFFRWMSFTIGAALMLVISRNLVMLTAAWMLTSLGLHKLLTHYPERHWALWTARKKFLISRLGDLMLVTALGLTYGNFGTTDYQELFAAAALLDPSNDLPWSISLVGVLYALGAMTKCAQFPFHSWLPDTMEAPTPVSALMHAGIINAGGFLVIRLSPLISLSPVALDLLKFVGLFTAIFGSLVMLTQPSIKRTLAYSTIAQMGFMMLQCGLGAYSAATLHIVAHACYKGYAFLMSGSCAKVIEPAAGKSSTIVRVMALPTAITIAIGLSIGVFSLFGHSDAQGPAIFVLRLIPAMAMTQLIWSGFKTASWRIATKAVLAAVTLTGAYGAALFAMDFALAGSVPHRQASVSILDEALIVMTFVCFCGLLTLPILANSPAGAAWLARFYVHVINGFYVDIPARQLTARFWGRTTPVP